MAEITGDDGPNQIPGTGANDTIHGLNGNDTIAGRGGDDFIAGGGGADILLGNAGNDVIRGGTGRDTLYGGQGDDILRGGAGADKLSGDFGTDLLYGGTGNDLFYFDNRTAGYDHLGNTASDWIMDFQTGDIIRFGNYAANTKLIFEQSGSDTLIYVDLGGNNTADYLAATVINSTVAAVQAATAFGGFDF